jgi:Integrase core domain
MAASMVLDAIEQAIWTREQQSVLELKDVVHQTDRGSEYTSMRFTELLAEASIQASVGAVGSSYDDALAETINGLYQTELIKPRTPWRTVERVELAAAEWVDWFNNRRLYEYCGEYSTSANWRPPTTLNARDQRPAELSHHEVSGLTGTVPNAVWQRRESCAPTARASWGAGRHGQILSGSEEPGGVKIRAGRCGTRLSGVNAAADFR